MLVVDVGGYPADAHANRAERPECFCVGRDEAGLHSAGRLCGVDLFPTVTIAVQDAEGFIDLFSAPHRRRGAVFARGHGRDAYGNLGDVGCWREGGFTWSPGPCEQARCGLTRYRENKGSPQYLPENLLVSHERLPHASASMSRSENVTYRMLSHHRPIQRRDVAGDEVVGVLVNEVAVAGAGDADVLAEVVV